MSMSDLSITEKDLVELASDADPIKRMVVAVYPKTPGFILDQLANDPSWKVREAVKINRNGKTWQGRLN